MAIVIPPGWSYLEVIMTCIGDSEPMLLTTGVKHDAGVNPTAGGYRNLALHIADKIDSRISVSYSFIGYRARQGQDGDPLVFEENFSSPVVGDRNLATNPPNVAVLVRKVTGLGGRKHRGRWFIPGVIQADQSDAGIMTEAARALWQTAMDELVAGVPGVTPDQFESLAILHNDNTPPTPVTGLVVQTRLATQRRRLRP